MKQRGLFVLWGGLFVLCAGLGFVPDPQGTLKTLMTVSSVCFFIPPAIVLWRGQREDVLLIRNLSALSLGVTLVTLILNFVLAVGSETLGNILHYVLVVVSTPMIASGHWALSLFLWACLLMASLNSAKAGAPSPRQK